MQRRGEAAIRHRPLEYWIGRHQSALVEALAAAGVMTWSDRSRVERIAEEEGRLRAESCGPGLVWAGMSGDARCAYIAALLIPGV